MPRGINLVDEATIQGRLWSPAQFPASSLALWLDAADTATISSDASSVIEWRDKSGNARHATQPTIANRPRYDVATINGRNTLSFTATLSHHLLVDSIASIFNGTSTPFTVMYAGSYTNTSGLTTSFVSASNLTNADYFQYFGYSSAYQFAAHRRSGSSGVTNTIQSGVANDQNNGVVGHSFTGSQAQIYYNGTSIATGSYANTAAMGSNLTAATIGGLRRTTNSLFVTGNLGEIVVRNTALSTKDRQLLEGYLAWKWGISRLPASHTFTNRPPLVGD